MGLIFYSNYLPKSNLQCPTWRHSAFAIFKYLLAVEMAKVGHDFGVKSVISLSSPAPADMGMHVPSLTFAAAKAGSLEVQGEGKAPEVMD